MRGVGGEHTPIGTDGTIDISPSKRLFITEAEIITALYNGIKELLKLENTAIGRDMNAQPGVNEVVLQEQAKTGEALLQETADEVAIENGEAQADVSKDEIASSSILDINSDRIMDSNDIIAALDTDDDGNLSAVDMVPSVVSDLVNEVIESKQEGAIESKSDPMDAKVNVLPSNVPEVAQFSNEVVADAGLQELQIGHPLLESVQALPLSIRILPVGAPSAYKYAGSLRATARRRCTSPPST